MPDNRLAVITGGTQGIGRAFVETFAANGFDVITCARTTPRLEQLKQELEQRHPGATIHTHTADLALADGRNGFVERVSALDRPVEVLINNAGVFVPGPIHVQQPGVLEQLMQTNLYSAYYVTRGLMEQMMGRRRGYIFNICSTASIEPYVIGAAYGITKAAMLGMSRVLREELKPFNVHVTSVIPGATYTPSWEAANIPPSRFIAAEDIAEMVWAAYKRSPQTVVEEIVIRPMLGDLGPADFGQPG